VTAAFLFTYRQPDPFLHIVHCDLDFNSTANERIAASHSPDVHQAGQRIIMTKFGPPGFAGAWKTDPPCRFILRRETTPCHRSPLIGSVPFVHAVRTSSRPARFVGHRTQGPSRLAVAVASVLAPASAGYALTVPNTMPRLRRLVCRRSHPRAPLRTGTFFGAT
jgi:hypothetical protein